MRIFPLASVHPPLPLSSLCCIPYISTPLPACPPRAFTTPVPLAHASVPVPAPHPAPPPCPLAAFLQGGTILVDGVLASDQSEWLLDEVVPASWRPHLPAVYGVLTLPGRLVYRWLGPELTRRIDAAAGVTDTLRGLGRLISWLGVHIRGLLGEGTGAPAGPPVLVWAPPCCGVMVLAGATLLACACAAATPHAPACLQRRRRQ